MSSAGWTQICLSREIPPSTAARRPIRSGALLLAALASKAGDRVDLIAFDRKVRAQVAGTSGARLMPALADAMAPLDPALVETDWPGVVAAVQQRLSQRALVVLLTALDPAVVTQGLLPVVAPLAHDHTLVVASVTDPEVRRMQHDRGDAAQVQAAQRGGSHADVFGD